MSRLIAVPVLAALAALVPASAASAAPTTFRGTTSQDAPLTLTIDGTRVTYRLTVVAECDGEEVRVPVRGTTRLTAKRDFLAEGQVTIEGADDKATFQVGGSAARPTATTRTGTVELTGAGCDRVQSTWRARKAPAKPKPKSKA